MPGWILKLLFTLVLIFTGATPLPALAVESVSVLIVANAEAGPYLQSIQGFKAGLADRSKISFVEYYLTETEHSATELTTVIREHRPALIFAVGGASVKSVLSVSKNIPVVATMVLKRSDLTRNANVTGVSLAYPLSVQFQWLKRFLPGRSKLALLFNPQQNETTAETAKIRAKQAGLEITAIPVETPKQLPYALEQLAKNVDALFTIPDDLVLSANTAQAVLLASFRNRVPMVGLSDNWVKSGALYALSWDYEDLGRQCAGQAVKLLNGAPVSAIEPELPRKVMYSINIKIANHMNVSIPPHLLEGAKLSFQ